MEITNRTNLNKEAEEYLASMKAKFQTDTKNWERWGKEILDKVVQLIKSGIKPSISRGSSGGVGGRTLSINVSFESNTDAAKAYLESVKAEIPVKGKAFHKVIEDFDKKLEAYHKAGLDGEVFEKLVKHFAQWVDYAADLHLTIRDNKLEIEMPEEYLARKKHWLEVADTQRLHEDAKKYGIPVEDVPKHRKYLEAKQKRASARTSAAMKQAVKLLKEVKDYLDSAALLAQAEEDAAALQEKEAEAERIRKEEEARRKREEAERERIRKEQEAAAKAEAERIAKEKAKKAEELAKKMRWRYQVGAGMVASSTEHCVAAKSDGTVVAVGKNDYGQCNVAGWRNVVQVVCDRFGTAALTADGRVLYAGNTLHKQNQCTRWTNVKQLAICNQCIFGLRYDGTVVATTEGNNGAHFSTKPDVTSWRNITAIHAEECNVLGIQQDGKIVAISRNYYGRCEADYYMDGSTSAVDAAFGYLNCGIVLHKDGKCTTAGTHYSYVMSPNEINKHAGIVKVHMLGSQPVAILSDGTLVLEPRSNRDDIASFVRSHKIQKVAAVSGNNGGCAFLTEDGRIFYYNNSSFGDIRKGECFGTDFRLFDNFHAMMDAREAEAERIRRAQEEEARRRAEEEARRAVYREHGVCQYCGGVFKKGLFGSKCGTCGKKKDYN